MTFKSYLTLIFILIIFFSAVAVTPVNGEEADVDRFDIRKSTDLPLDDEEILEMIENNTPSIDPKEFEGKKSSRETLAVYGTLPEKNGVDSYDWNLLLLKISKSVQNDSDFQKYRYANGGPVNGYGSTYVGGYMTVNIDSERAELKQEDLDQIQKIFEKYANENGVQDLPLVIEYGPRGVAATEPIAIVPIGSVGRDTFLSLKSAAYWFIKISNFIIL